MLRSTSKKLGQDYPPENVSAEGEIVEFRNGKPESLYEKAKRDLAAFKFELYETIAADPMTRKHPCLQATVALGKYVTIDQRTLKPTSAYLSNISMMAEAGIRSKTTCKDVRALMVKLKYWVEVGQTADGCAVYRLDNPRLEAVQMHIPEAKDKLRADSAAQKENERRRKADQRAARVPKSVTPQMLEGTRNWDDRVPVSDPNYLRANLTDSLSEGENIPSEAFPIPQSESEAVAVLVSLFDGAERPSWELLKVFRTKLMSGSLTRADIAKH
ncbi:MAG: hypothetical protein EOQ34_13990 [Mesorhizobium sp.]|nr:hypothetical protein [Mesorhizobium sp.]RWF71881.1 MAG: hypothetical protein EOQ34_13990 [Mesorhizobium sp.]